MASAHGVKRDEPSYIQCALVFMTQRLRNLKTSLNLILQIQSCWKNHPSLYELMSRMFLIKNSTPQWRLEALRQHFTILQEVFTDKAIQLMYVDEAEFDYFDKKAGYYLLEFR